MGGRHERTPFTLTLRLKTLSPFVTYSSSKSGPPNSTFDSDPRYGAGMMAWHGIVEEHLALPVHRGAVGVAMPLAHDLPLLARQEHLEHVLPRLPVRVRLDRRGIVPPQPAQSLGEQLRRVPRVVLAISPESDTTRAAVSNPAISQTIDDWQQNLRACSFRCRHAGGLTRPIGSAVTCCSVARRACQACHGDRLSGRSSRRSPRPAPAAWRRPDWDRCLLKDFVTDVPTWSDATRWRSAFSLSTTQTE
jgi:hypothetical protein